MVSKIPAAPSISSNFKIGSPYLISENRREDIWKLSGYWTGILKTDILYRFLPMLDPDLVKMWEGAVEALHGTNPDFIRLILG